MKKIPFYPLLFAIFSTVAMFASNIHEIEFSVILRPFFLALAIGGLIFLIIQFILRDWHKAALLATLIILLFFTYGHIYDFLQQNLLFGLSLGRHRFLIFPFIVAGLSGGWLILKKARELKTWTQFLNLLSIIILILPTYQVVAFSITTARGNQQAKQVTVGDQSLTIPENPPDIYYIILDSYTRADALKTDFKFDNSSFIEGLNNLGFYVAECSRSNYQFTEASLTASLNMDYLPELEAKIQSGKINVDEVWSLIKYSRVRQLLEGAGYHTITFRTGYEWSNIKDSDLYLRPSGSSSNLQSIQPFETMLLKSTAFLILSDTQNKLLQKTINNINYPFKNHILETQFEFSKLPQIPSIRGSKFVFVHIIAPHIPFIFGPDGEILTDTGYYGGKKSYPINDEYYRKGYTGEVQYVNTQMLAIVKTLISESKNPPIIILQGDHGARKKNRNIILNAYYFPGAGNEALYSGITPVNSFRVLFNTYFNTHYDLLPDDSYDERTDSSIVPDPNPACLP